MEGTFTETSNRDTGPLENIRISNVNFPNTEVTISSGPEEDNPEIVSIENPESDAEGGVSSAD
jgi:hypothetical protein